MTVEQSRRPAAPQPNGTSGGQFVTFPQAIALADQHRQAGRLAAAEELCWQVLRANPRQPAALHLLGIIAHQRGQAPTAIDFVRRAIAITPDMALYHSNLGEICRLAGRPDEALAAGLQAVRLDPDSAQAHCNLGIAHYDLGDYAAAIACYRRAVTLDPGFAKAYSNLGNAFRAVHRLEEAIAVHERALTLQPGFADGHANLGSALHLIGRIEDAVAAFQRALALDPQNANAHHGLSIILLLKGRLAEGWREYEWRWRSTETLPRRLSGGEWQGEYLNGRRLMIHAEQGFGDVLQFCRYLPLFRERIGHAVFLVPEALRSLLAESFPWLEVTFPGRQRPVYDCYCALLSLPRLQGTVLETIPATVPYLRTQAGPARRWAAEMATAPTGGGGELRVGIVWAGNPKHINDINRSLAISFLVPVLGVKGVRFFSLQVGERGRDLQHLLAGAVTDLAPMLTDFAETAAAIAALDLLIAVDTSVGHLAGALGKPVWLLLPWVPDWRWLLDRSDSPWYPTMRLFRQTSHGDWATVLRQVGDDLAAVVQGDRRRLLP